VTSAVLEATHSGTCKTCRRAYLDRVWGEDEFVLQNKGLVRAQGEEAVRRDWRRLRANHLRGFSDCPLNCKFIVHFADEGGL
jgi:hypothetical protein